MKSSMIDSLTTGEMITRVVRGIEGTDEEMVETGNP